MKIFKSKLFLFVIAELVVFIAIVYWYSLSNTFTITEAVKVNPKTGETKTVIYRLNKRTGEVWELGTNMPVNLKK